MQILISNSEVAVLVANWTALDQAGMEFEKKVNKLNKSKIPNEVKKFMKKSKEEKTAKVMKFLTTPDSEIKAGPVTFTKVNKGVGITIDSTYVTEFIEIYLTSIIPMFNPMYDLLVACKDMENKLKALDKKFETKK